MTLQQTSSPYTHLLLTCCNSVFFYASCAASFFFPEPPRHPRLTMLDTRSPQHFGSPLEYVLLYPKFRNIIIYTRRPPQCFTLHSHSPACRPHFIIWSIGSRALVYVRQVPALLVPSATENRRYLISRAWLLWFCIYGRSFVWLFLRCSFEQLNWSLTVFLKRLTNHDLFFPLSSYMNLYLGLKLWILSEWTKWCCGAECCTM